MKRLIIKLYIRIENPIVKKFDKLNNYHKVLGKAIEYLELTDKVEIIKKKIDEIEDYKLLERLIEVINNELQGR